MKGSKMKFLIVDDANLIRCFLKSLLNLYDLDAEIATNGQEAINAWEKENFTAILMDLEMPVMGGLEASRIIRLREKEELRTYTPIFAVSGAIMSNPHRICLEAGMDGFIAKPVTIDGVLDVILPLVNGPLIRTGEKNGKQIKRQIAV